MQRSGRPRGRFLGSARGRATRDPHRCSAPDTTCRLRPRLARHAWRSTLRRFFGDARRIELAASAFTELGALLWAAEAESSAASAYREAGLTASARRGGASCIVARALRGTHAGARSRRAGRGTHAPRTRNSGSWPRAAPQTAILRRGLSYRCGRWRTTSNTCTGKLGVDEPARAASSTRTAARQRSRGRRSSSRLLTTRGRGPT